MFAELSIRKDLNEWFFLQSGVQYHRLVNKVNHSYEIFNTQWFDNQVIQVIRLPDGTIQEVFGEVEGEVTVVGTVKRFNPYHAASIPLPAGLKLGINGNLDFQLSIGGNFSVWTQQSGQIINEDKTQGVWQNLDNLPYRTTDHIQGLLRLESAYYLNSDLAIGTGLQFQYDITNRLEGAIGFEEKYHSMGLWLGFRKIL